MSIGLEGPKSTLSKQARAACASPAGGVSNPHDRDRDGAGRPRAGVGCADGLLRGGDRPGHDEHAHDPVRRRRSDQGARAARARADPPARGLGRARRARGVAAHARDDRGRAGDRRARGPRTSRRSASPTSARRRSCGTGTPARRCPTRSSGRTRAPPRSCASSRARTGPTACASASGCRCRRTSPARSSPGSWTTCPARASAPSPASWRSGRSTRGCCGTSPAGRRAACTRPT